MLLSKATQGVKLYIVCVCCLRNSFNIFEFKQLIEFSECNNLHNVGVQHVEAA